MTPYGGSIQQQVFYSDSELCDATQIDNHGGYPERKDHSAWKSPYILMVNRGSCAFVSKVRNAQRAGASAVLIADNICQCNRTNCIRPDNESCETQEPLMADDGSGSDVTIPSFLLFKEDADEIKKVLLKNQHVRAQMSFKVPAPDARVEYELWTAPPDGISRSLEETFGSAAVALSNRASFKPHPYIYDGVAAGCHSSTTGENVCYSLCLNNGRYCSVDPDDDINNGATGADVVVEALRRICIWQQYGKDGIGEKWWNYVTNFIESCDTGIIGSDGTTPMLSFNDVDCVASAMRSANIDEQVTLDCMKSSGELVPNSNATNHLLDQELIDQKQAGVVLIPSLVVNGAVIHGSLSFSTVLKAICSGFATGSEPDVCINCANCRDELDCITHHGMCRSGESNSILNGSGDSVTGIPLGIFSIVLLVVTICFGCLMVMFSRRQQTLMHDQVRGVVAEYMPVTSQNTRSGDTSLGGIPQDDDDDDYDNGNNNDDGPLENGKANSSSFSIT